MNSNWSYDPETAKWDHDLLDLDLWHLTLAFCMDITSVNGNISWKFQDDTMTGTLSKRCDGRTDGQKCSKRCLVPAKNKLFHIPTFIHDRLLYLPLYACWGATHHKHVLTLDIYINSYHKLWGKTQHKHILTLNYDVFSENMGIHGSMLYIFKTLAMRNAKKIELGFSVNQLTYRTDLKYTINYTTNCMFWTW